MSFTSSTGLLPDEVAATRRTYSQQQLGAKVEMVYSLLSMLGTHDREDMSRTLLAMSSSPDSCVAMRQSGRLQLTQERRDLAFTRLSQFPKQNYLVILFYEQFHRTDSSRETNKQMASPRPLWNMMDQSCVQKSLPFYCMPY
jgi:hypothetical protein